MTTAEALSTDPVTVLFDLDLRTDGWHFSYPAGCGQWNGPFTNRSDAEAAVLNEMEQAVAENLLLEFGLN